MSDKVFIDSNVIIYSLGTEETKKRISVDLLKQRPTISVQVVNEVVNIAIKKLKIPIAEAYEIGRTLIKNCNVVAMDKDILVRGFELSEKHLLSHWDSLIIAAAIENNCNILYTEDMHHGQIFEDKLTLKNPYLE